VIGAEIAPSEIEVGWGALLREAPNAEDLPVRGGGPARLYRFPPADWSELRSTDNLERVDEEIARRSDFVGTFPTAAR
jgi:hypothetical protein